MKDKSPDLVEAYQQIQEFLKQTQEDADLSARINKIELKNVAFQKDLENIVKETKIKRMIDKAISDRDSQADKIKRQGIQWGPMIERIIITVLVAGITAAALRGFGV